jgi:hypothetical protein
MNKPLVRKFQPPPVKEAKQDAGAVNPESASTPQPERPPATDFDIPEINTNFIDNLFTDPTFVDRFDVAFGQTMTMGLDGEVKLPAAQPEPDGASQEWPSMLDISFTKTPPNA